MLCRKCENFDVQDKLPAFMLISVCFGLAISEIVVGLRVSELN